MEDLSRIIFFLYKRRYNGILNLGSGRGTHLKEIAKIIGKKYRKEIIFKDNKKKTYLVADIKKLKRIYKFKISSMIKDQIF